MLLLVIVLNLLLAIYYKLALSIPKALLRLCDILDRAYSRRQEVEPL